MLPKSVTFKMDGEDAMILIGAIKGYREFAVRNGDATLKSESAWSNIVHQHGQNPPARALP